MPHAWRIGPVTLLPNEEALVDLRCAELPDNWVELFQKRVGELQIATFAQADGADIGAAIDLVAQAVDVLRVFQHVRYGMTKLTCFGLPGELGHSVLPYIKDRSLLGFNRQGEHLGWTFSNDDDWKGARVFQWVGQTIGCADATEAQRRALIALQALSKAIVDQRSTMKMVQVVMALEALLLDDKRAGQTFRLARHVAYFGCGTQQGNLCGRSRETCPYLALDPANEGDRRHLRRLRTLGTQPPWLCSEWHQTVGWYDLRSEIVHGRSADIPAAQADAALFWVLHHLVEPILLWLSLHEHEPIDALHDEISSLPPAPDWEARLGRL